MHTIFCLSSDTLLLGELLRAGYDVRHIPEKGQFASFLTEDPKLIIIDGIISHDEILVIEKLFPSHPAFLVRSSSVLPEEGITLFPSGTTNAELLEAISSLIKTGKDPVVLPKKVLIIEDNRSINEMYQIAFSGAGCEVISAYDGLEGITKAAESKPDVILLDLMMPNMDGFEMLTALKNNTSLDTKVIVNSNLEGVDEENKARAMGADGFLKKSTYTPLEVVDMILTGKI